MVVKDLRQEFAEEYCFPMLRAHAVYEQRLPAGHVDRPAADRQAPGARAPSKPGADAVGHGATGKGNDQVRFELTYMALDPKLKIIAPVEGPAVLADGLTSRETAIDYAKKHDIPIDADEEEDLLAATATSGTSPTRARRSKTRPTNRVDRHAW